MTARPAHDEPTVAAPLRGPYDLSEEQVLLQRTVQGFAAREIAPSAHEYDEREEFACANVAKTAALNLKGMLVPEAYGGPGGGTLDYLLALEAISRGRFSGRQRRPVWRAAERLA